MSPSDVNKKSVCDTSTPLPLILEGWGILLSFFSDILYMNILQQILKTTTKLFNIHCIQEMLNWRISLR